MKANKLIEKFNALNLVEEGSEAPTEEIDFDKDNLTMIVTKTMKRIEAKPAPKQALLLLSLTNKLMKVLKDKPQGEKAMVELFKEFKSELNSNK